jgi:hypothetical protein
LEERLAALESGSPAKAADVDAEVEWPDATDESAFLSEAASRGEVAIPAAIGSGTQVTGEKLPSLEEMVARVPADVAALLDDLFRAKFTGVRRYADSAGARPESG